MSTVLIKKTTNKEKKGCWGEKYVIDIDCVSMGNITEKDKLFVVIYTDSDSLLPHSHPFLFLSHEIFRNQCSLH